jgi:HAE1 family hydrophobic/amphiphilic exporter-1
MRVVLQDSDDRPSTTAVIEQLRPLLARGVPGADFTLKELGGGETAVRDDVMIEITGPDPAELSRIADRVIEALEAQPNIVDIGRDGDELSPEIQILPDPVRVARAGLNPGQLALLMRVALEGDTEARVRRERQEDPIRVRLQHRDRDDVTSIAATTVQTPSGAQVPLRELARVVKVDAPSTISRMDRYRRVTVYANLAYGTTGDTTIALEQAIDLDSIPDPYKVRIGGEEEQRKEAAGEIMKALLLAIVLTYMLLAGLLESFVHPISILSTVPLALIGVLTALAASGVALDIFGLMALVLLVGIVVNNAILMLEETARQRDEGVPIERALEQGAILRMRPIMMTSLSTIAGMVPLALALGAGAELRQAMALVSIGGVAVSSLLILVACPVIYHLIEDARERLHGRRLDRGGQPDETSAGLDT